jgi:hypothetical protein
VLSGLHVYVKVNVDAAMAKTSDSGALGAVCKHEDESFLGASSLTITSISDPATLTVGVHRGTSPHGGSPSPVHDSGLGLLASHK